MNDVITQRCRRLDEQVRERHFPTVRPRDAATLIIIDRTATVPKVLLGRRHHGHKFLPGAYVFPGGRSEPTDRRMPVATELDPQVEARLMLKTAQPSPDKARGLALACVRETFEETGLLIGRKEPNPPKAPAGLWQEFTQFGVLPDLAALHFISRAITPPGRPKRFDTRFFAVDAAEIVERREGVVGPDSELVELNWVPMPEAVHLGLLAVTTIALEELQERIADGMPRDKPVPFYRELNGRFVHAELD